MARFFEVKQIGQLHGQDVVNIWWYRADIAGLPEPGDLQGIHDTWMSTVWAAMDNLLSNTYSLRQVVVSGYRDTFERVPYLPLIVDHVEVGATAAVAGPPIQCAILTARVEPQENGYRGVYPGPYTRTPVRRGYWALSGLLDAWFMPNGKLEPTFLGTSIVTDMQNAAKADLSGVFTGIPAKPVKVSQPPAKTILRGWGFVRDAKMSPYVSARRSRKVGRGAG